MHIVDYGWRKLHGLLLMRDMGRLKATDKPISATVYPYVEAFLQKIVDHLGCNSERNRQLLEHSREVGLNEHSAVEGHDRNLELQRFGQHRHSARRSTAGDGSGCRRPATDRRPRALGRSELCSA